MVGATPAAYLAAAYKGPVVYAYLVANLFAGAFSWTVGHIMHLVAPHVHGPDLYYRFPKPIRAVLFAPDSHAPRHWPGAGLMAINYKRGHWLEAAAQDFLDYRHNIKPTKKR